ncbi:MAG: diphthine--ammonia ligase, partial [Candidatus Bathyarchaeota archaeon]|nr:diphthine--ammonia ligase [Candidatus Bathyarchaeota archaeon]
MNVAALVSGGKDSALALYRVLESGHNVRYLVTMIPRREDSWMFHYPNIRLTGLFAEAVGIPLVRSETSGIKEEELEDLRELLATLDVEGIVSGAVFSEYQKSRIDRVCRELGFKSVAPLWHEDPL